MRIMSAQSGAGNGTGGAPIDHGVWCWTWRGLRKSHSLLLGTSPVCECSVNCGLPKRKQPLRKQPFGDFGYWRIRGRMPFALPPGTLRIRSMERSPALSLDERTDNAGSVHFNSVGSVSYMVLSVALPVSLSGDQCHHAIH